MFSDYSKIKLEVNNDKIYEKSPNIWKLTTSKLSKDKGRNEKGNNKICWVNENENTTHQNL